MSAEQKHIAKFVKMNGAGNDFVIFDARKTAILLTPEQVKKISDRKNIGCDQLIIIKNIAEADCEMQIYNSDGSLSGTCGNATRCVASILFSDLNKSEVKIKTAGGVLKCWKNGDLISVDMGTPKFGAENVIFFKHDFACVDVGNPHAVTFMKSKISDEDFFNIGPKVEIDRIFPNKTNVEFARILSDNLIEVRVWERGAGETLACGSGACAVAVLAIKKNLVKGNKITVRFKGGDLIIEWSGSSIVMTGEYKKIYDGAIDEKFFS